MHQHLLPQAVNLFHVEATLKDVSSPLFTLIKDRNTKKTTVLC